MIRLDEQTKRITFAALALFMLVNLALSLFIQSQKGSREGATSKCFEGTEGCATVQTSMYANTLGISNPVYGILFFSLWTLLFAVLAYGARSKAWQRAHNHIKEFLLSTMVFGTLFSLWLLYLQFFVIGAVCVYCLWVDAIMIACTVTLAFLRRTERPLI